MSKIWPVILVPLATFFQISHAQESGELNTVFFKITSPKTDYISYLFGTHHAFGPPFFDTLTFVNQILPTCDILIKENLSVPGQTAEDIVNRRTIATNWKRYLNGEDFNFIKNLFATSPTDFRKMTPAEMHAFLSRHFKKKVCLSETKDAHLSLDDYIGEKAQQMNLKLNGLETTSQQLELLNRDLAGMPRRIHKKRLANVIEAIQTKNQKHCGETEWYRKMKISYQWNTPCRNQLILTDRNASWMKKLEEYLNKNNCFIAVGLSHLMYDCSLISQLKELGFIVSPLEVN